jgi:NAD(P)-dependent dehydrogenase (short-subunit alcohol dehydrogenase family)
MTWTTADIPALDGRVALITGANAGLGFEAARALAGRGATVVLACRNVAKAEAAAAALRAEHPNATLDVRALDLASLASVRAFAEGFVQAYPRLDHLGLNAGLMGLDPSIGEDGLEMHFTVNHLGHFALVGHLMGLVRATPGARVVSHASLAHRGARTWGDPTSLAGYERWRVYGETKLANLLFALELQRRFAAAGVDAVSVAAHPGMSKTELGQEGTSWTNRVVRAIAPLVTQSATNGSLPFLRAMVDVDVPGGAYVGPRFRAWGAPVLEKPTRFARDPELAAGLWAASARWTGIDPLPA